MSVKIETVYSGEVLDKLLVRATTGNQFVAGGHIRIQPGVSKKFSIPRLKAGKMLQKRKESPTKKDSKGKFKIDEVYLEPKDVMVYTEFNPRAFEQFWRKWQPTGNLVFAELPAEAQNAMLAEMAKVVNFELGGEFISGKYGDNEGEYFDGILTRISASDQVLEIEKAIEITEQNIFDVLRGVKKRIPKALRGNANLKLFMAQETADIYDEALTRRESKGADFTDTNPERYKGIRIVPLAQWPENVIVAAVSSVDLDSNFWAGVSLADDAEAIKIDRVSSASELFFFKMLMKIDTNIVWGEDIVLYDGREAA